MDEPNKVFEMRMRMFDHRITQTEISKKSGLCKQTLSNTFRYKSSPNIKTINKIEAAINKIITQKQGG